MSAPSSVGALGCARTSAAVFQSASVKRPRLTKDGCDFRVTFLVDASGSMDIADVESAQGNISRIAAVFDAMDCFAEGMVGLESVACSVAIFNDSYSFPMLNQQVGINLREQLRAIRATVQPAGGGAYMQALRAMRETVSTSGVSVGVLLSDGVPLEDMRDNDCPGRPHRERVLESIRAMRREMGPKCILHTVGLGSFDPECLQILARAGGGSFYDNSQLKASLLRNTFRRLFATVSTLRATVFAFGPSVLRPLPQRQLEPVDAWETAGPDKLPSMSTQLLAQVMLPQTDCPTSELVPQGSPQNALLHNMPFAEGSLRYAFHFFILNERRLHLVVKEAKFAAASKSPLAAAQSFLVNHREAQNLAAKYKEACLAASASQYICKFVPAYVIQTTDEARQQGVRFVTAERYIPGDFVKFNGNDGYVNGTVERQFAQAAGAFSHFSFDCTDGKLLCVDVQGVGLAWTDPQLHSLDKSFGPADLGREGMKLFFASHVCSKLCCDLKLRYVDPESLEFGSPTQAIDSSSSSSSDNDSVLDDIFDFKTTNSTVEQKAANVVSKELESAALALQAEARKKEERNQKQRAQKKKQRELKKKQTADDLARPYWDKLYEYVQKNGPTTLGKLGQVVPRRPGDGRVKQTLEAQPLKFVINGDVVSIKAPMVVVS